MSTHSPIGASSMYRWAVCPGSVALSRDLPAPPSSPEAEEGTRAHEYAATWLKGNGKAPVFADGDEDMHEHLLVYVDHVFNQMANTRAKAWIEHHFDLSSIYPNLYGTDDAVVWVPLDKTLHVNDLKFGKGMFVSAENNKQLLYYALGALTTLNLPDVEQVHLHIIQPRCAGPNDKGIRTWKITPADVLDFAGDLVDAAKRTEEPNAPLASGSHCHFCPAIKVCPEVQKARQLAAQKEFTPVKGKSFDTKMLAKALDSVPLLRSFIEAVDTYAYKIAEAGETIPGYKLVAKRATRKWVDEKEVAAYMAGLNVPQDKTHKPAVLKTVAQMEQALSSHSELLKKFVKKESGGHTLVPESDGRPAIALKPQDQFTVIEATAIAIREESFLDGLVDDETNPLADIL